MDKRAFRRNHAAAIMLLTATVAPALGQTTGKVTDPHGHADAQSDIVVTETHIALIKNVLNLRAEQERQWAPVETALREVARLQARAAERVAAVHARGRASGINIMRRLKRIAAVAAPLLKSLDDEQRQKLAILARLAGLEVLLASR